MNKSILALTAISILEPDIQDSITKSTITTLATTCQRITYQLITVQVIMEAITLMVTIEKNCLDFPNKFRKTFLS